MDFSAPKLPHLNPAAFPDSNRVSTRPSKSNYTGSSSPNIPLVYTITMLFLKIVLAFMAYSPLVALAAPHLLGAGDSNFTIPKSLTNNSPPASKLYTGPWSSFPAMATWVGFDAMVSFIRYKTPSLPSSLPSLDGIFHNLPGGLIGIID